MALVAKLRERLRQRAAAWARRRQGADTLPLTLTRRRLYILPTRAGIAFGALVLTMLIGALNYANSLALLFAFLLAGFALVAMHECHRNLLGLSLLEAAAPPRFAGSAGTLRLTLRNASRAARYRVRDRRDGRSGGAGGSARRRPRRRSSCRYARPRAACSGSIGCESAARIPSACFGSGPGYTRPIVVIVYPRAAGSLPLPADSAISAGTSPRGAGGSDEWFGLRPFRDGDSPRQVAWKAYAREAPLLVKEYSSAGSPLRTAVAGGRQATRHRVASGAAGALGRGCRGGRGPVRARAAGRVDRAASRTRSSPSMPHGTGAIRLPDAADAAGLR